MKNLIFFKDLGFFKKPLTKKSAYVLGLIASDGCIYASGPYLRVIVLCNDDYHLMRRIQRLLGSHHKMRWYRNTWVLQFTSKSTFEDLAKLGITPRKSLTLKFPKIPPKLLPHFVRGFFDGDGNVYINYLQSSKPFPQTQIWCGSKRFLEDLSRILADHVGMRLSPVYRKKSAPNGYHIRYSNRDSVLLGEWMYANERYLFLKRKRDQFLPFLNRKRCHIC